MNSNLQVQELKLEIGKLNLMNKNLKFQVKSLMAERQDRQKHESNNNEKPQKEEEHILQLETENSGLRNQIEELKYKVEQLQEELQYEKLLNQSKPESIQTIANHPNYQEQINKLQQQLAQQMKESFIKYDEQNKIIMEQQQKITYFELDQQVLLAQIQEEQFQGRLITEQQEKKKTSHIECEKKISSLGEEMKKLKHDLDLKQNEIQDLKVQMKKQQNLVLPQQSTKFTTQQASFENLQKSLIQGTKQERDDIFQINYKQRQNP